MQNLPVDPQKERDRWDAVKSVFEAASALKPEQRREYLERCCRDDLAVRQEVERLLAHLDQAGSFLDVPAWHPVGGVERVFDPGDYVSNRFRITRFLGAGGMGEVYSAFDVELHETIALKVVSLNLARDPRVLLRLRQEIQLARKITHPNVCRVFDLGKSNENESGSLFVTMELLEGETLAGFLKERGALDAASSLPLISQIAAGLDAAHQSGVLHRDLKPGNVIMVRQSGDTPRAVITDFGLAKSVELSSPQGTLTRTGELMGTLAYMAPELLAGAPGSVASDIYALGVVILEMRTCRTDLAAAASAESSAALEPGWRAVISRCLAPDPAERYTSTRGVVSALRSATNSLWWRRVRVAVAALMTLSLGSVGFRLINRQPSFQAGAQIMITPTANYSEDPRLDGVTEAFRSQVNQSAVANLWDAARLSQVLRSMGRAPGKPLEPAIWREVAMRENVPLVVFSNITRLGEAFNFRVRIEATGRNPLRPSGQWEFTTQGGTSTQVFDAVRGASLWLRKIAGETASQISSRDRLPQDTTTASWEALTIYGRAEQAKNDDDASQAVLLFFEALQIDPDFAMAHARLGDILMSMNRQREAFSHWRAAVAGAHHHLTLREELRIRALYAIDSGDLQSAEAPLLIWYQDYPHDYLPLFYLGYVYRMQVRLADSARILERAQRLQADSYFIPASLARTYLAAKDYEAVIRMSTRLRELNHEEIADKFEGAARLLRGQEREAIAIFTRMTSGPVVSSRSAGYLLLGRAESECGRTAQAIEALEHGVQLDTESNARAAKATKLVGLAWLHYSDRRKARALALQALEAYAGPEICLNAGSILARLRFREDATSIFARLDVPAGTAAFDAIRLRLHGEIKLAAGRAREAIRDFEAASALEPPLTPRDYLARALSLAGDRERAHLVYKEILDHPGALWQNAETARPGALRDIEQGYRSTDVQNQSTSKGETR